MTRLSPAMHMKQAPSPGYELHFRPLAHSGRGFRFDCDPAGQVHLDGLSERTRNNYFYARAMVGREVAPPSVERAAPALSVRAPA